MQAHVLRPEYLTEQIVVRVGVQRRNGPDRPEEYVTRQYIPHHAYVVWERRYIVCKARYEAEDIVLSQIYSRATSRIADVVHIVSHGNKSLFEVCREISTNFNRDEHFCEIVEPVLGAPPFLRRIPMAT